MKPQELYCLRSPDGILVPQTLSVEIDACWCRGLELPDLRRALRQTTSSCLHLLTRAAVEQGWALMRVSFSHVRSGGTELALKGEILRDREGWRR